MNAWIPSLRMTTTKEYLADHGKNVECDNEQYTTDRYHAVRFGDEFLRQE